MKIYEKEEKHLKTREEISHNVERKKMKMVWGEKEKKWKRSEAKVYKGMTEKIWKNMQSYERDNMKTDSR